jgi:acyl carrier protein
MTDEIETTVLNIVAEQFGINASELSRETSILTDLNADEIDVVEIAMAIEDEFDVCFSEEKCEKITTIGETIDYIKSRKGIDADANQPRLPL